ncbi:MAG: hypothetical protein ACHQ50_02655 [Fimbriimonadales bacterium]
MRTTIDLPDELLRRAKAVAALRGMRLKDLVTQILEKGLGQSLTLPIDRVDHGPLPEIIPAAGRKIPFVSNAELLEGLEREEEHNRRDRSA